MKKKTLIKISKAGVRGYKFAIPSFNKKKTEQLSQYQSQFKAKQAIKKFYGDLSEKTYKQIPFFQEKKGVEKRLDVVLYRFGYARSILEARSLIKGGFVKVNNKVVNPKAYNYKVAEGSLIVVTTSCALAKIASLTKNKFPKPTHLMQLRRIHPYKKPLAGALKGLYIRKKGGNKLRGRGYIIKTPIESEIYV